MPRTSRASSGRGNVVYARFQCSTFSVEDERAGQLFGQSNCGVHALAFAGVVDLDLALWMRVRGRERREGPKMRRNAYGLKAGGGRFDSSHQGEHVVNGEGDPGMGRRTRDAQ